MEFSLTCIDRLNEDTLEDSLAVAPRHESVVFNNRGIFDLVVMYDDSSVSMGPANSPFSIVLRVIHENFRCMLFKNFESVWPEPPANGSGVRLVNSQQGNCIA